MRIGLGIGLNRFRGGAAVVALLDRYKGSAFAMSTDTLLYSTYSATDDISGSVTNGDTGQFSVAILRDSDNAVRSFTPAEVADGTANTWVQAEGAANGFVRRGYDQSVTALDVSNLNHANQTTTAEMPKLFDSSTGLILENGKAAMDFSSDFLTIPNSKNKFKFLHNGTSNTVFVVASFGISSDPNTSYGILGNNAGGGLNTGYSIFYDDRSIFERNNSFSSTIRNPESVRLLENNFFQANTIGLLYVFSDSDNVILNDRQKIGLNGSVEIGSNTFSGISQDNDATFDLQLGAAGNDVALMTGQMQIFVIFDNDQSTNRPGIETAINNEYSIYP